MSSDDARGGGGDTPSPTIAGLFPVIRFFTGSTGLVETTDVPPGGEVLSAPTRVCGLKCWSRARASSSTGASARASPLTDWSCDGKVIIKATRYGMK